MSRQVSVADQCELLMKWIVFETDVLIFENDGRF